MSKSNASRRPAIGITAGRKILDSDVRQMEYFTQPVYYAEAVLEAGGLPVILPSLGNSQDEVLNRMDGLLITGGEDVDPSAYGHARHLTVEKVDPLRDQFEITAARFALVNDRPLLGICRGAQVINVAAGGTLIQDLPSQKPSPISHWDAEMTRIAHEVRIIEDSRLRSIIGKTRIGVNTCHHQAVEAVASSLRPVAWADDDVIEAVEDSTHRWLIAVQWHPEMLYRDHLIHRRLFEALVEAAC